MICESDILIIGTGIAGMSAALYAAEAGLTVNLITKGDVIADSNTYFAQGGIIYRGEDDSAGTLIKDIMNAGAGLSLIRPVTILAHEGPYYIRDLLIRKARINFTKNEAGQLDLTEEAAHSVKRIIHSKDATGKAITEGLFRLIRENKRIRIFRHHFCLDLAVKEKKHREVIGAMVLDLKKSRIRMFLSRVTILAAGGMGQIYRYTTNPVSSTGDGIALASRAGARIVNMEYTQFHPTAFYQQKANMFLISEMVRGEGGRLKDMEGREFMRKYHHQGSLAPRDVVARALHAEMLKKGLPYMLLDIHSYMAREKIKSKFPTIYRTCLADHVDITRQPIPVVPAFHFICGGIRVDEWGRSSVRRLFAVGEDSCTGIHGANRLASTSLLEGLVWAGRSIKYISENLSKYRACSCGQEPKTALRRLPAGRTDPAWIRQNFNSIKNIMWNYAGLVRTTELLKRAFHDLIGLKKEIEGHYKSRFPEKDVLELRSAAETALLVVRSALKNKRSRGTHYRNG